MIQMVIFYLVKQLFFLFRLQQMFPIFTLDSVVASPSPDSWTRLRTRCAGLESVDLRFRKFFTQFFFLENYFCTLFRGSYCKKDA